MGLLGTADSTLVQGAFKAAAADVQGDLSSIYDKRAENVKSFTKSINAAWEGLNSEYNDLANSLTDKGATAFDNVNSRGYNNDHALGAVHNATNGIKDRLKLQKRDLKGLESQKIQAEMNRFASNTAKNSTTFATLADLSSSKGFFVEGTGGNAKLLEAILDDFNNNTNNTNITYKNGDFTYTFGGVTMTMSELDKSLIRKDGTQPMAVLEVFKGVRTDAKTKNRPPTDGWKTDTKNLIKGSLITKADRTNVTRYTFPGLKHSFYDALTGKDPALQEQIYSALEELGTDIDGDGKTDKKDVYANTDNAVALQQAILNNNGMDDLIAEFLTNNLFQDNFDLGDGEKTTTTDSAVAAAKLRGVNLRNEILEANLADLKNPTEDKKGNIGFLNKSNDGTTYVSKADAETKLNEIRSAKSGDVITHWQGSNTVRYVKTKQGMFVQEKYNAEKGGFEAEQDTTRQDYGMQMTTQDVEKDMNFPNTMLQTKVKSR